MDLFLSLHTTKSIVLECVRNKEKKVLPTNARDTTHTHSHTTSREKEEDHHHHHQQQQQQHHAPRRAVERHRSEVRTHGARDAPVSEENKRRARGEGGVHGSVFEEEEGRREERQKYHRGEDDDDDDEEERRGSGGARIDGDAGGEQRKSGFEDVRE